jgi:hypothetical protein
MALRGQASRVRDWPDSHRRCRTSVFALPSAPVREGRHLAGRCSDGSPTSSALLRPRRCWCVRLGSTLNPSPRTVQVRGGKFKLPFSRDELTGAMNLDFAFRSRAADQLAPGRSFGGMVHGRVLDRRLQYRVGLFREDGEQARRDPVRLEDGSEGPLDLSRTGSWEATATWAARSTFEVAKDVEIGAAMTLGDVPEGRNISTSTAGRTGTPSVIRVGTSSGTKRSSIQRSRITNRCPRRFARERPSAVRGQVNGLR